MTVLFPSISGFGLLGWGERARAPEKFGHCVFGLVVEGKEKDKSARLWVCIGRGRTKERIMYYSSQSSLTVRPKGDTFEKGQHKEGGKVVRPRSLTRFLRSDICWFINHPAALSKLRAR